MTVSVLIPSRLAAIPGAGGRLFLEDAVASIARQEALGAEPIRILVGVDAGTVAPPDLAERLGVELVASGGHGQAAALNAAAARAEGAFLAILEDDDVWAPHYLRTMLGALGSAAFASSTQLERDEKGEVLRINDFPTPSGWLMRRETFQAVGGFDDSYRWHLDNDWLGRLGESGRARVHLVEATAPLQSEIARQVRPWLHLLLSLGGPAIALARHAHPVPLVTRRVHPDSGMQRIARDAALLAESNRELERLVRRYGRIPW